jgi:DUF177 domain-containing protein
MLVVDFRDLHRGPVDTVGTLESGDPVLEGLNLELDGPVEIQGRLQETGQGEFFWHATLSGRLRGACRRCLKELAYPLDAEVNVLFSADPEAADDPSVYQLTEPVTKVDVRDAVREELALAVSGFPLCREECAGLCGRCGADLNAGPCACTNPADTN